MRLPPKRHRRLLPLLLLLCLSLAEPGQATANPRLQSRLVVFEAFMRST